MANRHYHFKFNTVKDATYIQRLDAQENMQNYIRRLILSDIAADSLQGIIHVEDSEDVYNRKIDYYNEECVALGCMDINGDDGRFCRDCRHSRAGKCHIEDDFEESLSNGETI